MSTEVRRAASIATARSVRSLINVRDLVIGWLQQEAAVAALVANNLPLVATSILYNQIAKTNETVF